MDELTELEFRDGKRWVPKHLALLMGDIETYRFTYADAIDQANAAAVRRHIDSKVDGIITSHFRRNR